MNNAVSLQPDAQLPALRRDLQILANTNDTNGGKQWLVFDPLRHSYFEIDYRTALILEHWSQGAAGKVVDAVRRGGLDYLELQDIEAVLRFAVGHELTTVADSDGLAEKAGAKDTARLNRWFVHYLFFRIPLVRPHRFFARTVHLTEIFFSRYWWIFIGMIALLGGYLVMRQWDEFARTFMYFFSMQGMLYYGLSLVFVKVLHELGHGYAATRYGCRIPSMGLAFMVLFPVLYTDTTDSWRVIEKRQRLIIDAAGVITELTVAVIATFLWAFMVDGPLRSVVFLVATASWLSSVLVNANPFMKFDGYHFLTDVSGIRNLQSRSFAIGQWRLRELLFDLQEPPPELLDQSQVRWLYCYAWLTWIYRLILFTGIALLVYHLAFKALGIVLFAVEIYWFIARPIWLELRVWHQRLGDRSMNTRSSITLACLALLIVAGLIPWKTTVVAPVLVEADRQQQLYIEQAGKVTEIAVSNGQEVVAGEVVMKLSDPDLQRELAMQKLQSMLVQQRIDRAVANPDDRDLLLVLEQQRQELNSRNAALVDQIEKLNVVAPIDGVIRDFNPLIHGERWVATGLPVAMVVAAGPARARGYVAAKDVTRLTVGAKGSFFSHDAFAPSVDGELLHVDTTATQAIQLASLASVHGGRIASQLVEQRLVPGKAWYPVELSIQSTEVVLESVKSGVMHIEGSAQSLFAQMWQRIAQVGIREMGF